MSRRRAAVKREFLPDSKYGDLVISKFINSIMQKGKKSLAERIVYGAIDTVCAQTKRVPMEMFHEVINSVKPSVEVRSRRVGGATYQVPMEVRPDRQQALAIRWIVKSSLKRSEKTMEKRLGGEIQDILNGKGGALKKRSDILAMASANKIFSHFRW